MLSALTSLLRAGEFSVVEQFEIQPRDARHRPIPVSLRYSPLVDWLHESVGGSGELWNHQAIALEDISDGHNVVVSTGTASGKSLIFRAAALDRVIRDPDARVVVFYPLKALASDQLVGWQMAARRLGLPDTAINRIDGGVIGSNARQRILSQARIVLMTPDVCHAWLMAELADPTVKRFVRNLDLIILDEAHTLEGVFGSNFAFLFRRLQTARSLLLKGAEAVHPVQVIAATATISNPVRHLEQITGLSFIDVSESEDGSRHHPRSLFHIACLPGHDMTIARELQVRLLRSSEQGSFITFVDSRKGVEMMAVAINREMHEMTTGHVVMPYRGGLEKQDREEIESGLKDGALRGVISTSALELGIDIPHFQVGLNLGVPATRKAFRQRLGRIGRTQPGAFIIVAEQDAFTRYGTSFYEYYQASVEPSYLYLENRFMQFAQARCLLDELETLSPKGRSGVATGVQWPGDFLSLLEKARPGGDRPREFDAIAGMGGDTPQRNYPLRNIGEVNFKIQRHDNDGLGDVTLAQALRECYPGAVYYHAAKPYRVKAWRPNAQFPYIQVENAGGFPFTRPRVRTWINASLDSADIIDHHYRVAGQGFIAECQMQITERVEGYHEGDKDQYFDYRQLQERDPNMRPRNRHFRTTGALVRVDAPWFKAGDTKQYIADRLKEIFCREYSVLPQDVGASATNISVASAEGNRRRSDCIVLFDQTYGSLRLTERVYSELSMLLQRLAAGIQSGGPDEQSTYGVAVDNLRTFVDELGEPSAPESAATSEMADTMHGFLEVYASGSIVGLHERGTLFDEVEIISPDMLDGQLLYRVKHRPRTVNQAPVKRLVPADRLEPLSVDGDCLYALWDPTTQEYVEESFEAGGSP